MKWRNNPIYFVSLIHPHPPKVTNKNLLKFKLPKKKKKKISNFYFLCFEVFIKLIIQQAKR